MLEERSKNIRSNDPLNVRTEVPPVPAVLDDIINFVSGAQVGFRPPGPVLGIFIKKNANFSYESSERDANVTSSQ